MLLAIWQLRLSRLCFSYQERIRVGETESRHPGPLQLLKHTSYLHYIELGRYDLNNLRRYSLDKLVQGVFHLRMLRAGRYI